mmetsp:Transcript_26904/g.41717  ORF Transcript_26904/g.41717 Transcript_26904/m.41717 type:complete len:241 (+) Transcript_26904:197-919(+)|eukprot:CAMPEP_0196807748 /NCGR_PEP_ID=MMETSP1362-20130617/7742_1 /TAXON_ID=163516 /ORGANISM="Leptocylindrus danicus, Strain CCMP1856" /LENGTH=240 /DNA_ID=CAMNT_0042181799 /DNA_START=208 /DNA_END=930 /DNA_ORIENTATION=+
MSSLFGYIGLVIWAFAIFYFLKYTLRFLHTRGRSLFNRLTGRPHDLERSMQNRVRTYDPSDMGWGGRRPHRDAGPWVHTYLRSGGLGRAQNDSLGVHSREQRRVLIAAAFEKSTSDGVSDDVKDGPVDVFAEDAAQDEVCIICLSDYGDEEKDVRNEHGLVHSKYCRHKFHKSCIVDWLEKKNECPCCRNEMMTMADIEEAMENIIARMTDGNDGLHDTSARNNVGMRSEDTMQVQALRC